MAPLPSLAAFCSALLKTFSNTRGTARMNVGRNEASAGSSAFRSPQCPRTTPPSRQPTWMIRAKTCASGRKSSVLVSGISVICASGPWNALRTSASRFAWVSSQPLGRPVVPEV